MGWFGGVFMIAMLILSLIRLFPGFSIGMGAMAGVVWLCSYLDKIEKNPQSTKEVNS